MLRLSSKYYHLLHHRYAMSLSFGLLLNMIFLGPYATAGDITIKGKETNTRLSLQVLAAIKPMRQRKL